MSYNVNGGSGTISSQSKTAYMNYTGSKANASFTVTSTEPSKTGYTFQGWSTSSTATTASYVGGSTISLNASDILYAVWKDITPPTMGTITFTPTGWTNQNVTITGRATDFGSGISYYQFSTSGSLTASSTGWTSITNTTSEISRQYTVSSNDTYYFYVKDAAGNINKKAVVIDKIDKNKPTITNVDAVASGDTSFTLTISAKDTGGSGLKTAYVTAAGTTKTYSLSGETDTLEITDAKPSTTYSIYVEDKAGNVSTTGTITTTAINYRIGTDGGHTWTTTLQQAISAANSTDTITLLTNYTDSSNGTISGKNITFDVNGKNYTRSASIIVNSNATFNLSGTGKVTCSNGNINLIQNNGKTYINNGYDDDVTITGTNRNENYSLIANLEGGTMYIAGGTLSSDGTTVANRGGTLTIFPSASVTISATGTQCAVWNIKGTTKINNARIINTNNTSTEGNPAITNWDYIDDTTTGVVEIGTSTVTGSIQNTATFRIQDGTRITQDNDNLSGVVNNGNMSISGSTTSITGSSATRGLFNNMGNVWHSGGRIQNTGGSYSVYNTGSWNKNGGTIVGPTYGL